ncbi:P-loop containing nucleoside triphosphate hydrolase protein [Amniculicola lignicola CBS 123094]|uniref:P-loop containing nucleoside triphosphate hydrolase protein n=1 Tax=Amniculicola lignicola CBS 123094 TaxID=1392246 RepID=A0A6A5WEA5_9PLEO|nr:P-loop containing nucleoside triphosphate hydrolase protein [Amniculicola lignicola CBS 123094]
MPESVNGVESSEATAKSLEQKYIKLLEQKIADLEKSLAAKDKKLDEAIIELKSPIDAKRRSLIVSDKNAETNGTDKKEGDEDKEKSKSEDEEKKDGKDDKDTKDEKKEDKEKKADAIEVEVENPRIRLLDSRWDEKTGTFEEVPSKLPPKNKAPEPSLPYAFTWLRKFDEDRKYTTTRATVQSPALEELIKDTCRPTSSTNAKTFSPNYDPLVWDWNKLADEAKKEDPADNEEKKQARKDLDLLMEQVKASSELTPYFEKRESWAENKEISYDFLWTLFPPGEMVCSQVIFDQPQAFIAREYEYMSLPAVNGTEKNFFQLICWSYDWNGETFNRVSGSLKIERYTGAKSISTLKFYPIHYHVDKDGNPDEKGLRQVLKERGKRFKEYVTMPKGSQLFYCDGPVLSKSGGLGDMAASTIYQNDAASTLGSDTAEYSGTGWSKVKGAVIVDHRSFLDSSEVACGAMGQFEISDDRYECTCSECMKSRSLKNMMKFGYDNRKASEPFEDDQYIICPARFLGYIMGTKAWAQMPVKYVHEIKKKVKVDAFDNLILDRQAKALIRSLVGNHEKKKSHGDGENGGFREDWIEGKGRGLVILLHGPPGVGKTSTAESVAQATGKPLFTVSVSDIGMKPDEVEGKLALIFNLAARWEAVLLFDEADVFLESRGTDKGDLNRNSLVTVFLRILEYYDGILILTTNRIKSFDIAVQSRVHLAIRYKELSTDQLRELFLKFIKQHREEILDVRGVEDWIKEEFDEDIDGRQIRNVVNSARAMARAEDNPSGKVKLEHIRSVLKMTVMFQKHLRDQRVAARRDQVIDK